MKLWKRTLIAMAVALLCKLFAINFELYVMYMLMLIFINQMVKEND